jgi:prepilin-type N-terminal cleavage/methylation domain-containing protein
MMPSRRSSVHRSGFTLLELMVSVGLTTLLMGAIYGAMSTYWNLAMDSHDEIERSQIARSLLQKLARDIRACTFAEQTTEPDTDSLDSEDAIGTDEVGTSVYKNGLIGTDRDLVLYISYPARELNYVPAPDAVGTVDRNSDLMIVRWLMAESNGGGLSSTIAEQHATDGDGSIAGLARGSGGVTGFGQAIENDNVKLQVESTKLLAAEVQSVLFEYFDGVEWLAEWDTSSINKMPQAVRIELTLRKAPESGDGSAANPRDLPATTHQLVVPIPVASPYVEETAI